MAFFKRKSDKQLASEIKSLRRDAAMEAKRERLESQRKETLSKYRSLKYRKPIAAAKTAGRGLAKAGSVGLKLAGNAAYNLSRHDVSPQFKSDFKSSSMVNIRPPSGGFGFGGRRKKGGVGLL